MKSFFKKLGFMPALLSFILLGCPAITELSGLSHDVSENKDDIDEIDRSLESIRTYLSQVAHIARKNEKDHEKVDALMSSIDNHNLHDITPEIIDAAFSEAAQCFEKGASDASAQVAADLETRYDQAYSLIENSPKRSVKNLKKFLNVLVHHELSAGELYIGGDAYINRNLTVEGNEVINGNLTVNGQVVIPAPDITGNINLIGTPEQACIIFKNSSSQEKARICSSPVVGDKGVFISVDNGATQNFRVNNEGAVVIEQPTSGAALTIVGGGEDVTGTTNINTTGSATTSIGYGGTGAVNLGNSVGNVFLPTTLDSSQLGDVFVVIDPTTGQVRLDVGGDTPGAIINGGQPGPITIGTTNATSLALVTSGSNNARFIIDPAGNINVTTGTFSVDAGGANITGNTNINTSGTGTTTLGNCPNTTTNIFGTTNINSAGTCTTNIGTAGGATNIGSSASTNTLQGTTSSIGNTFMSGATGVILTVTGNATNPSTVLVGNNTTIAPALRLINNPASIATDNLLTIDALGNVKQGTAAFGNVIYNGGQPGPLTIGTTDATTMSFITNDIQRIGIDGTTGLVTIANGETITTGGLTVSAGGASIADGITATSGDITANTGNISAAAGNILGNSLTITTTATICSLDVTCAAHINNVTIDNLLVTGTATVGKLVSESSIIAATDITATTGNIAATSGSITAGTTITAGTGLTVSSGPTNIGNSSSINTLQGTTSNIGNTFMSAASGVVLTVTGNATNPSTVLVGNSSTTAPALKLINNPAGTTTDFFLTIDSNGVVKQTTAPIETGFIINGGQPGPLTIGTTDATSLNFITNNSTRLAIDPNGNITMPGLVTTGSLDVLGTATIRGLLYQLANTISPNNTLYVQKGPITAPNQFNTITDALDAITTNSVTNRFEIEVSPGTYIEPTLTLKPYVVIVGDSQETCIIQASDPNQDLIIGCANSTLKNLAFQGATGAGSAALVYNDGGEMHLWGCIFGSNDILINQASAAPGSFIVMLDTEINADAIFTTGFQISPAVAGMSAGILAEGLLWGPYSATITDFVNVTGVGSFFYGANFSVGSGQASVGNAFLNASDGALVRAASLSLSGFNSAIYVPVGVAPGPNITIWSASTSNNVLDINILNPFTMGSISGTFDTQNNKVFIDPGVTGLAFFATASSQGGITMLGPIYTSTILSRMTNISPLINFEPAIGVIDGGIITGTTNSFTINVSSGTGYLMAGTEPSDYLQYITWQEQSLVLTGSNSDNYIYIDPLGIAQSALSEPSATQVITLGKVRTGTLGTLFVQYIPSIVRHLSTELTERIESAFGPIYISGSIVTKNGDLQLDASSGSYVFGSHEYDPMGGTAISWEAFLGAGTNTYIGNQSSVDYQNYDNSGTLAPIPLGEYARHELYIINGPDETYALVYSQTTFDSLTAAVNGVNPIPPATWTENICPIAAIIVTNTTVVSQAIQQILDERPRVGFSASSVAGVSVHGNLLGLLADDHPQYLLVNGTRAMSGSLNMGANNITNAGTITANGAITAGGAGITGTTTINTTGAATTTIGNPSSTTTITGPTNINTSGAAVTTIGNNVGPSTTSMRGATTLAATSGIPLSITGNASNPSLVVTGNSTTIAPALRLVNTPTGTTSDFFLTIDTNGIVKRTSSTIQTGFIVNGGQAGPLTIGTTDATTMSFITNNAQRIGINGTTGLVSIANGANIADGMIVQGLTQINTGVSGSITTIGNTAAPSTNNIYGTTNINTTASGQTTTIGADANTTTLLGTVNVNTGISSGTTTIGNNTGPSTTNITGPTNINTSGTATTDIGTAGGATNIGNNASVNTLQGTTRNIGNTLLSGSTGVVLTVTGNATNPSTVLVGNSSTTAPALKLINNPAGTTTDFFLTIDSDGVVKQTTAPIETGFIINGGQPGPLTIGTTDATTMSFITNNVQRIGIDGTTGLVTIANGETITTGGLTVSAGGASIADGITATSGDITANTGNISAAAGNILGNSLTITTTATICSLDVTCAAHINNVTIDNLLVTGTATVGKLVSESSIIAATDITSTTGNIAATSGSITAGTTITAGTGLTVSSGPTNIGNSSSINTLQGTTSNIGNTFMSGATGVVLTVTGNATNPSTVLVGSSSTTAPALKLINNPAGTTTDFFLTIDSNGVVKQTTAPIQTGFIINGGQPGPLTIGTTDATTMSFITNNLQRIGIDSAGAVTIATPTAGTGLTIAGGGESVTGTTIINSTGAATTSIGNASSTTTITGPANINTSGTATTNVGTAGGATNIGSSASANTLQGTTRNIGNTFMSAATGVVLTVTGNATNPSTVLVGSSSTTAPALKLINNPAGTATDFFLTIDSNGVVKQTTAPIQTGFIINGGQPGPLTIGTTNATSMNFITNNTESLEIASNGNVTIPGFTTIGSLDVLGTATINGLLYQLANTVSPNNVLYVQKGPITAPNQFNSVKTALDSITGNSVNNPFAIQVGPGVFVEDAMVMKPWVSIIGVDQNATTIAVNTANPANVSLFTGAANSTLGLATIQGSTAAGFSALIYTDSTGEFHVGGTTFINNSTVLNMFGNANTVHMRDIEIDDASGAEFSTTAGFFNVDGSTPTTNARFLSIENLKWFPSDPVAANFDFIKIVGPSAAMILSQVSVGNNISMGGNFINNQNAAQMSVSDMNIAGFNRAIYVPDIAPPFPGFGPLISIASTATAYNSIDLEINQPFTSGSVQGVFDFANGKVIINPAITSLSVLMQNIDTGGITMLGPIFTATTIDAVTNVTPALSYESEIGVLAGGSISGNQPLVAGIPTGLDASFTVTIASGDGYLMIGSSPNNNLQYTTWPTQAIILTGSNTDNYLYINQSGMLQSSLAETSIEQTIQLGKVRTGTTGILFIQEQNKDARHMATKIEEMLEQTFGPIYVSGSIVTQTGALQLSASEGNYYFGNHQYQPAGGTSLTWEAFLGSTTNRFLTNQNSVDYQNYDDGSGSLTTIPLGNYAKHQIFVIGDGATETYALVYSQTIFNSLNEAIAGNNPLPPATWSGNISPIAAIIVTNTTVPSSALQTILDTRPRPAFVSSTVAGSSGNINTLAFLTLDGTRVMNGHLQMGNNDIADAANITGSGLLTIGGGANITGATTINNASTATTSLGTGGGTTNLGGGGGATTNIGASTGNVNISGTVGITGVTNINIGSSTNSTTIGNNTGPSTTNIRGATTILASAGIPLSVTGNVSNPTIMSTGSSTTTAPALKLINNPAGTATDFFLTIDSNGVVKQTTAPIQTGFIINGGQPGPLTIGTTDATTMSFITNNLQRIGINSAGAVTIATPTAGTGLTIAGGGESVTGTTTINTTGAATTTIGNASSTTTVTGPSNINTTGAAATTIGNASSTTTITGPANINTSGTATTNVGTAGGATNIGSSASANTLQGTTRNIGNTFMSAASGVVLTVTGNATNPSTVLVGSSSTTAPALKLINNPAGVNTDFFLTIDSNGVVKQTSSSIQTGFIINGGQPGPLTIGTTNATTMSFITNNVQRIGIDGTTGLVTVANGETITTGGLTVSAGGANITGTTSINTTGALNTTIGNASSTTTVTGPANVNTTGAAATNIGTAGGATNIGSSASSNTLQGTTRNIGNTFMSGASGVVLTVTGNATNPATVLVGNSSTTAPAARFIGNPASATTDNILTIDASGNVKQGTTLFGNVIYNGGQTGPLTIGTTDATNMSFITNNLQRIGIDSAGAVTIAAPTTGIALTVNGAAVAATNGATINQSASSTTGSALSLVGINGPTGAPLTISAGTGQNSITTSAGTVALPAYSFTGNTTTGMYAPATNQLALATNATQRLNIDATGSVTASSVYKAHAYRTGSTQATAAATTIIFNSEASPGFDPNANFSTVTGLYTAPVTGYYLVSTNVSFTPSASVSNRSIQFIRSGTLLTGYIATFNTLGQTTPFNLSLTGIVQLNAAQTIGVQFQNATGTATVSIGSSFDVHFLSL